MEIITTILEPIAVSLGATFIRSQNLSEANIDLHYDDRGNDIMIYNGQPKINTIFSGAEIIDVSTNEIYFLRIKPDRDMLGSDMDSLYQAAKLMANQTYEEINTNALTARDIETYDLEPMEIGTDMYVGYMMTVNISTYNEGCQG